MNITVAAGSNSQSRSSRRRYLFALAGMVLAGAGLVALGGFKAADGGEPAARPPTAAVAPATAPNSPISLLIVRSEAERDSVHLGWDAASIESTQDIVVAATPEQEAVVSELVRIASLHGITIEVWQLQGR